MPRFFMDLDSLISIAKNFITSQPLISGALLVVILAFTYIQPKFVFKSLVTTTLIWMCAFVFMSLSGTLNKGINEREKMLEIHSEGS